MFGMVFCPWRAIVICLLIPFWMPPQILFSVEDWLGLNLPDFSRFLPIPHYISNATQAMIQSALATADKSRSIFCEDFCSIWAISKRKKKQEGRRKHPSSLPPPIIYHCWSPLRPGEKSAMDWEVCGMTLDRQRGRNAHCLLEFQDARGTLCDRLKH